MNTGQRVHVRLLGDFALQVDGEDRGAVLPTRVRHLLAYLALHPDTAHSRQRVAFRLWPDTTEAQARTNLRNVLHHLRRAGPAIESLVDVAPSTLRWAAGDSCTVDVIDFVRAVADGDLRTALALYRGDLLRDCYEEWLEDDRARLRTLHENAVGRHAASVEAKASQGARSVAARLDLAGRAKDAIGWYRQAASQALEVGAHDEAVEAIERALELTGQLPGSIGLPVELDLLALIPAALVGADGYYSERIGRYHERAAVVAARLGVDLEPPVLSSMVMGRLCLDDFHGAAAAVDSLRQWAARTGDEGLAIETGYLLGIVSFWRADLTAAAAEFRWVIGSFDALARTEHLVRFGQDPQVVCLSRLAVVNGLAGRPDAARQACAEALELAAVIGDPLTTDVANVFAGILALDLGDTVLLRRAVERLTDDRSRGVPVVHATRGLRACLDIGDGAGSSAIEAIEQTLDAAGRVNPAPGFFALMHRIHVAACVASGDFDRVLTAADRALAWPGSPLWKPTIELIRADADHKRSGNATSRTIDT